MVRRPVIGKLITPGFRPCSPESGNSPTTPFEFKVLSPRGMIHTNGIGLGIVAGLENIPAKKPGSGGRNPVGSDPVEVGRMGGVEEEEEEEYTIVTRRKADKSYTKVYRGGLVSDRESENVRKVCIFKISPVVGFSGDGKRGESETSGFLSCCLLCDKRLHGRDIFMYRGEKGFCSPECRSRHIVMDEKREKNCSSEAAEESIKSPSTGYPNREMFTSGIYAI